MLTIDSIGSKEKGERWLDLKAAARSVGEKSVEMIPVKEINAVTGYIRGGRTAVGMKKAYVTRIHVSAREQEQIIADVIRH